MQRLQHRLTALASSLPAAARLDADSAEESLAAALLHDLGHGPFSHLFEEVLPGALHHEDWTQAVLLAQDSEVHRALETRTTGLAARVAALLRGEHRLSYLPATLSGTLDVDRADYLLRDSHMSGVRYGLYDLDWLLQAQTVVQVPRASGPDIFCLAVEGRKGLPPIESFFLGRHFMYQQVYHHKAVRAAETLVRWLFRRLRCL
ncbi:MAG: HD domain-containing protein, partial [Polyangiales bacterium]